MIRANNTAPALGLLVALMLLGPAPAAHACSHTPFMVHVGLAEGALKGNDVAQPVREAAAKWLAQARDGRGPLWTGDRQIALNKALTLLGLPTASRGPDRELSPAQRQALLKADAEGMPQQIADMIAQNAPDAKVLAQVDALKDKVALALSSANFSDAVSAGNEALVKLGVAFPRC